MLFLQLGYPVAISFQSGKVHGTHVKQVHPCSYTSVLFTGTGGVIYCTSANLFDRTFIQAGHGREGRAKRSEDVGGSRLQHPPSP